MPGFFWPETSIDIFPSNTARYARPTITIRECNSRNPSTSNYSARVHSTRVGLGVKNPCQQSAEEYAVSSNITTPLVEQIQSQRYELRDESRVQTLKQIVWKEKNYAINEKAEDTNTSVSQSTKRILEFASEKGASAWLTVIPISEMVFNLNKRESRDGMNLRYDWPLDSDIASECVVESHLT